MTNPNPENRDKNKLNDTLDQLKKNEKIEGLYNYATNNTRDTIAYILMIVGIVLLFTNPFWGGLIVGLIFGYYFSAELLQIVRSANDLIEQNGMVRSLIFGGLLLALFVAEPAIFIGAAIAVALRQAFNPETK
jgi:F0F1-type ATP synthase assembly protein I